MTILLWTFFGMAVGYILYVTISFTWPFILIAVAWGVWNSYNTYYNTDAGAHADVAYYCDVLGKDQTTQQWKDVYEYTLFDERHIDDTGANYYGVFRSMSCDTAKAKTGLGEYAVTDYKHSELGFIRRYFYFRNGEVRNLYRDRDQFLWQRALLLRVEEGCNLDRETLNCVEVPHDSCSWYDTTSSYSNDCQYDAGKGRYTNVLKKNVIKNQTW